MMKLNLIASVVVGLSVWTPATQAAFSNVAEGKPVIPSGAFGTTSVPASKIVDGIFLPESTGWTEGTVWWEGLDPTLTIDLQGNYKIFSFIVQADDNDAYKIEYRDSADHQWKTAWDVPNYDTYNGDRWGMTTRPNPDSQNEQYLLTTPITADQLRFFAVSGDGSYAVSEIQAFGTPVPEPSTYLAGLSALGMLGLFGWRNRK